MAFWSASASCARRRFSLERVDDAFRYGGPHGFQRLMPKIENWDNLPAGVRQHLIDRMRDRAIRIAGLNQLRLWIRSKPEVPEG